MEGFREGEWAKGVIPDLGCGLEQGAPRGGGVRLGRLSWSQQGLGHCQGSWVTDPSMDVVYPQPDSRELQPEETARRLAC